MNLNGAAHGQAAATGERCELLEARIVHEDEVHVCVKHSRAKECNIMQRQ